MSAGHSSRRKGNEGEWPWKAIMWTAVPLIVAFSMLIMVLSFWVYPARECENCQSNQMANCSRSNLFSKEKYPKQQTSGLDILTMNASLLLKTPTDKYFPISIQSAARKKSSVIRRIDQLVTASTTNDSVTVPPGEYPCYEDMNRILLVK